MKTLMATLVSSFPGYYECVVSRPPPPPNADPGLSFNLVICPGNPGHPGWYDGYVQRLSDRLPRETGCSWRITVVGLKGHVSSKTRKGAGWARCMRGSWAHHGLDAQVDHVSDFVKADIDSGVDSSSSVANSSSSGGGSGARREHTIVLGHSIGAYLGLEVMRRHPEHVHSFVGIMPFLEANELSPEYAKLRFLLKWFGTPLVFVGAVVAELASRLLPLWLCKLMMKGHTEKMDAEVGLYTVDTMLSFGVVANYLHLGKTEFVNHAQPFNFVAKLTPGTTSIDSSSSSSSSSASASSSSCTSSDKERFLASEAAISAAASAGPLASRCHFMYTDGDFWAPLHVEAKARAAGVETSVVRGLPHAFGVTSKGSEAVADWTTAHLKTLVDKERQKHANAR